MCSSYQKTMALQRPSATTLISSSKRSSRLISGEGARRSKVSAVAGLVSGLSVRR